MARQLGTAKYTHKMHVMLTPEQYRRVLAVAQWQSVSIAEMIREAIDLWLTKASTAYTAKEED